MRIAVVIVFAVAALFAGGVFYFLLQYMQDVEKNALELAEQSKPGIDAVEVLVADRDLPAGSIIASEFLDWQPWPDDSLGDGYVVYREDDDGADQSSLEEPLYDMIVRRTILEGEPITEAKLFTRDGASFLSGMLTPGMRAVAIKVQDVTGVGGFIMPGDRVDVIVSIKWKVDQDARKSGAPYIEYTSETIVQNARVMGIDQAFDDFEENVAKASAITIEGTPKQAEIIAIAVSKGNLSLSLRSLVPGQVGAIHGFTSDRETFYSMGGGFPTADRLAQPIVVAGSGGDGSDSTDVRQLTGIQVFRAMTARRDLVRGTLLRQSDVEWAALSKDRNPEDYVIQGREAVTPRFLRGILLNMDTKAGEPLLAAGLFLDTNAEFLGLAMRPGMRAIKIEVRKKSFNGTPGDEIDVVLIGLLDEDQPFSETIMQKVRVLSLAPEENGAVIEVTPKQFETLALATELGTLQLSLRSNNTLVSDIYGGTYTSKLDVSRAISGAIIARAAAAAEEDEKLLLLENAAAEKAAAEAAMIAAASQERETAVEAGAGAEEEEEEIEEEDVVPAASVKVYRSTTSTQQSFSQ